MLQKQCGSGNISVRPPEAHPPKMLEAGQDTQLLHKALDSLALLLGGGPEFRPGS